MKYILRLTISFLPFFSAAQNVGIGTSTPQSVLHIAGTNPDILRLDGTLPYISFYDGGVYEGYLWHDGTRMVLGSSTNQPVLISPDYNNFAYFTTNGRLGLGISNPAEVLDVQGNINTSGLIKLNNSAGTAGQVITSNGNGNPTWKNTSFTNTTRFGVVFLTGTTTGGFMPVNSTAYNLNTTDITIGTNSITINRTGLYHFTSTLTGYVPYFSASVPSYAPQLAVELEFTSSVNTNIILAEYDTFSKQLSSANSTYWYGKETNGDIYLQSGTVLHAGYNFNVSTTPVSPFGPSLTLELYGYLISD